MQSFQKSIFFFIAICLVTSCAQRLNNSEGELIAQNFEQKIPDQKLTIAQQLQTDLIKLKKDSAPDKYSTITLIFLVKEDVQASIKNLVEAGGKLLYDPNQGVGSTIPFYIGELTPELILDKELIESLDLKAASFDKEFENISLVEQKEEGLKLDPTRFIPTDSVGIDKLTQRENLGEGVTIAVLDTGVDASHPAFDNRVVYMYDATLSSRINVQKLETITSEFEAVLNQEGFNKEKSQSISLHESIIQDADEIYYGFFDLDRTEIKRKNLLAVVRVKGNEQRIFVDLNQDYKIDSKQEIQGKIDYNKTTKMNRLEGMINFPNRNNIIRYPVMLEQEDNEIYLSLGETAGSHGSHVAGIAAANDPKTNLLGAAPKADIMSLRVCDSGCSYTSIVRGLYKAFYNGKVVPDVVNMSLGSHEKYNKDVFSYVFNDLAAKFGTVFFISASNSGPGFRSLNHFGNSGPMIMVGANVSKKTWQAQYNLPSGAEVEDENLLFFSSLGPSYTGEMKPNIVAPGGAIASVEAASSYMAQMNGTSMSSPLAAGAFAAVLSELKKETPEVFSEIEKIRALNMEGQVRSQGTLLPYVYAMRDSLQNSAKELKNLSRAQQGYGLIQVDKAKSLLEKYLTELNQRERDYVEVVINDYKKSYERELEQEEIKKFNLSLGLDGERSKESLARFIAQGLDVTLTRVEILSTTGDVEVVAKEEITQYFSIVEQGNAGLKATQSHVPLNNGRKTGFFTYRNLKKMETGKTYLAHYTVSSGGIKQTDILDVVHRPLEFGEDAKIEMKNQKIKLGSFHRYPIKVSKNMNELVILSDIISHDGRVFVQLYDPTGKERLFDYSQKAPILDSKDTGVGISTITEGEVLTGTWEITVSSVSSTWFSEAEYDLNVYAKRFGFGTDQVIVTDETNLSLSVVHDKEDKITAIYSNIREYNEHTLPVKAGFVSMHPLTIPKGYQGKVEITTTEADKKPYYGQLITSLFIKNGDEYEIYTGPYKPLGNGFLLPTPSASSEKLYFGYKTMVNYDFEAEDKFTEEIQVRVAYSTDKKIDLAVSLSPVYGRNMSTLKINKEEGNTNKFIFDLIVSDGSFESFQTLDGKQSRNLNARNESKIEVIVE